MYPLHPKLKHREKAVKTRYRKPPAVKLLERMADEAARAKYPDTPPSWLAPRRYRDDNTSGLTRCAIHFLRFKGHHCERTGNTGRPIDQRRTFTDVVGRTRTVGSLKWIPGAGTNGTSDLKAIIDGRFVAIEIKCRATNDRLSPAQKAYQMAVQEAGGLYVIARDFTQFMEWYHENFTA